MAVAYISTTDDDKRVTSSRVATFDDESAEQEGDWFWDVRHSLESFCGTTVTLVKGGVDNTRAFPSER
jgi:hypothetical protein